MFRNWIPAPGLKRAGASFVGMTLLALAAMTALAQPYPSRPVKIIVAFTPGSATDIIARVVADDFSKSMGQPGWSRWRSMARGFS